jgi:branched-chain amino acid transport system permease protein
MLALVAGGLVGAAAATIIGIPALRIRGLFLAVTTLSFALATSSYLLNPQFMSWLPTERFERPFLLDRISVATEDRYYYFTLACLMFVIFAVRGLRRSRTGRVLIAMRENERAAQAYGVSAIGAKLTAFAFSGFIAAFAGVLLVHHQQILGSAPYRIDRSFEIFVMTVVGGIGSVPGAIIGAAFVQGLGYFRSVFPQAIQDLLGFITGPVGVIFVLMMAPGGLAHALYTARDSLLRRFAIKRNILVPSLLADRRMDEQLEVGVFEAAEAHATTETGNGDDGEITAPIPKVRERRKAKAKAKTRTRAAR